MRWFGIMQRNYILHKKYKPFNPGNPAWAINKLYMN